MHPSTRKQKGNNLISFSAAYMNESSPELNNEKSVNRVSSNTYFGVTQISQYRRVNVQRLSVNKLVHLINQEIEYNRIAISIDKTLVDLKIQEYKRIVAPFEKLAQDLETAKSKGEKLPSSSAQEYIVSFKNLTQHPKKIIALCEFIVTELRFNSDNYDIDLLKDRISEIEKKLNEVKTEQGNNHLNNDLEKYLKIIETGVFVIKNLLNHTGGIEIGISSLIRANIGFLFFDPCSILINSIRDYQENELIQKLDNKMIQLNYEQSNKEELLLELSDVIEKYGNHLKSLKQELETLEKNLPENASFKDTDREKIRQEIRLQGEAIFEEIENYDEKYEQAIDVLKQIIPQHIPVIKSMLIRKCALQNNVFPAEVFARTFSGPISLSRYSRPFNALNAILFDLSPLAGLSTNLTNPDAKNFIELLSVDAAKLNMQMVEVGQNNSVS